jgi:hypothetical protein
MSPVWDRNPALQAPMFAPLHALLQSLPPAAWPGCEAFNALLSSRVPEVRNAAGLPLRFVPQSLRQASFEEKYEPRIFLRSEVQMRAENWHDLFNALVWLAFPQAKAVLNRRHYQALRAQQAAGMANRGPQQDALTLFDEGGVVVLCADPLCAELLRDHRWHELFWQRRDALAARMGFFIFGHALYEKALQPFSGVTGRGLIFACSADLLHAPAAQQNAEIDALVAGVLNDDGRLVQTRELAAVPIFGIPGWCAENERESYYDDRSYFRPAPLNRTVRR